MNVDGGGGIGFGGRLDDGGGSDDGASLRDDDVPLLELELDDWRGGGGLCVAGEVVLVGADVAAGAVAEEDAAGAFGLGEPRRPCRAGGG